MKTKCGWVGWVIDGHCDVDDVFDNRMHCFLLHLISLTSEVLVVDTVAGLLVIVIFLASKLRIVRSSTAVCPERNLAS